MAAHAKLSASSSARWLSCPGSVQATENLPNPSSKYALEGSAAHELGEICLKTGTWCAEFIGKALPETRWTVDEEMAGYVQEYVDLVQQLAGRGELEVEVRLDFSHIVPDGFGTSDAITYDPLSKTLTVIDLILLAFRKRVKCAHVYTAQRCSWIGLRNQRRFAIALVDKAV